MPRRQKMGQSIRAYAAGRAVSDGAIRRYIDNGVLRPAILADGSIDPAKADEILSAQLTRGDNADRSVALARMRKLRAETVLARDQAKLADNASVLASVAAATWEDMVRRFAVFMPPVVKTADGAVARPVPEAFQLLQGATHAAMHAIAEDPVVPAQAGGPSESTPSGAGAPAGADIDLDAAGAAELTAAKLDAQAVRLEIERAVAVGDRVPVAAVTDEWLRRLAVFRAALLNLPHRIAPLVAEAKSPEEARAVVKRAVADAFGTLEVPGVGPADLERMP